MKLTRRNFLGKLSLCITAITSVGMHLLQPVFALVERNFEAFSATTQDHALAELFPKQIITPSKDIWIEMHETIEDGSIVPIKIQTRLPNLQSITILVEKNPNPLIAIFNLTPLCTGLIETRIKIDKPSLLTIIVQSNGQLFKTKKMVNVILGGCG